MKLPKKINPDNLIETIVEIKMIPTCLPDLWAGMISNHVQKLGFEYRPTPQLSVRLDKNGKIAVSVENDNDHTAYGMFVKKDIRFIMQGNSLSFNCNLGHYVGWNIYQEEIRNVIKAVLECKIAENFNRVQIRYISEYVDIDIIDKINGKVYIEDSDIGPFKSQEIKLSNIKGNTKVFVSLINKAKRKNAKGEERLSSLFDVNVYENFKLTHEVNDVVNMLDKVHKIEKETFFGLLKQDFIQSLDPEY